MRDDTVTASLQDALPPEEMVREIDFRLLNGDLAAADDLTGYALPRLLEHVERIYPSLRGDSELEACVLETLRDHYRDPFWWGGAGMANLWDCLRLGAESAAGHLLLRGKDATSPREAPETASAARATAPEWLENSPALAARAAAYFSQQPECLGYWLTAYRAARAMEPAALASELGCSLETLHHLLLCLRPHEDRLGQETVALAARYGIQANRLGAIFLEAWERRA